MKNSVTEPRILPMRPAPSRNGLYLVAGTWHAPAGTIHPFVRPTRPVRPGATRAFDRPEPPYLPDGPSAA